MCGPTMERLAGCRQSHGGRCPGLKIRSLRRAQLRSRGQVDLDADGAECLSGCVLDRPGESARPGIERQDKPRPVPRRIPYVSPTDALARLLSCSAFVMPALTVLAALGTFTVRARLFTPSLRPGPGTLVAFTMLTSALGSRHLDGALSIAATALGMRRRVSGASGCSKGQNCCGDDREQVVRWLPHVLTLSGLCAGRQPAEFQGLQCVRRGLPKKVRNIRFWVRTASVHTQASKRRGRLP